MPDHGRSQRRPVNLQDPVEGFPPGIENPADDPGQVPVEHDVARNHLPRCNPDECRQVPRGLDREGSLLPGRNRGKEPVFERRVPLPQSRRRQGIFLHHPGTLDPCPTAVDHIDLEHLHRQELPLYPATDLAAELVSHIEKKALLLATLTSPAQNVAPHPQVVDHQELA